MRGSRRTILLTAVGLVLLCGGRALANDNPALGTGEPNVPAGPPPPPPCEPWPTCDPCKTSSSPVLALCGQMFQSFDDLPFHLPNVPLSISRTYHSDEFYVGLFGRGFVSSLDMMTVPTTQGNQPGDIVLVRWPDGQRTGFTRQPAGTYAASAGRYETLTETPATLLLRTPRGSVYTFNKRALLLSLFDPNGNTATVSYDPQDRPIRVTVAGGDITLVYNASGFVQRIDDFAGRQVDYGYDANGFLTSFTDAAGDAWNYEYDGTRLARVRDALGRISFSVSYDAQGRVSQLTEAEGDFRYTYGSGSTLKANTALPGSTGTTYFYDTFGVITRVRDAYNRDFVYEYNSQYQLTRQTDRKGTTTTYTYDSRGNVLMAIFASNRGADATTWTYTYEPTFNQIQSVTDPLGVITKHEYDSRGNRTKLTEAFGTPLQRETVFTYNAAGNLVSRTDALNGVTSYTYDAYGNVLTEANPLNKTTTYTYDDMGNLLSTRTPLGHTTRFTYDGLGRVISQTDSANGVTSLEYEAGHLVRETDPRGGITEYTRDGFGRITQIKQPGGATTSRAVRSDGLVTSTTDALNKVTLYEYDLVGNRLKQRNPLGEETNWTYDANGNQLTQANGLNHTTSFTYDHYDRLTRITDPLTRTRQTQYDALGRVTAVIAEDNGTIRYFYDILGRKVTERDPLNNDTAFEYNKLDNLTKRTTPDTAVTVYAYDAASRLTRETDALNGILTYVYDDDGRLIRVVDQNNQEWRATYDGLNRITEVTNPLGKINRFSHDGTSNLASWTNARLQQISYTYDPDQRPVRVSLPGGITRTFTYDILGRLTRVQDPATDLSYSYDAAGREVTVTDNRLSRVLTFTYDAAGNRASMDVGGLYSATLSHNTAGRLTGLAVGAASWTFTRDPVGRITGITRPGGLATTYVYNLRGDVTQIRNSAGGPVLDQLDYQVDSVGRYTRIDFVNGDRVTYVYDLLSRLTSESRTGTLSYQQSFGYDAAGNRTQRTRDGVTTTYVRDTANRLTQETTAGITTIYVNDDDGNRIQRTRGTEVSTYTFDAELHLVGHTAPGHTAAYATDAFGRVVAVTIDGATSRYLHDGLVPVAAIGGSGPLEVWVSADQLILRSTLGAISYEVLQDVYHSVRRFINAGSASASWEYGGFGTRELASGTAASMLRFAGRLTEPVSGDPLSGRGLLDTAAGRYSSGRVADSLYRRNDYAYRQDEPLAPNPAFALISSPRITPDEAGWWGGRDKSGDNTIGCDGSGNLTVFEVTNYQYGVQECTRKHEQQHVDDWYSRYGRDICKGRAKGDLPYYDPPGKGKYADFIKASECGAWRVGQHCRDQKLRDCCKMPAGDQDACKNYVRPHVQFANQQVNKYCN